METTQEETLEGLKKRILELEEELDYVRDSFIKSSFRKIVYEAKLNREEIISHEFGKNINEKHGTMYEIKSQARRFAQMIGLDSDLVRMMVTEAIQNVIEHGYGQYVDIHFELDNDPVNPSMISTFKNIMPPGKTYTLSDINKNALKGDMTSGFFDFENPRGRGEYIMKQLTDERRIINGIEINEDGNKVNYFKRILINYKNPQGSRTRISFHELKIEIDRLDYEDVVCLFHVQHNYDRPIAVTVATTKSYTPKVIEIMTSAGFTLRDKEEYYRTVFVTFDPEGPAEVDKENLLSLFKRVRQVVYREIDETLPPEDKE